MPTNHDRLTALKRVPLLASLPHGELEHMATRVEEQRHEVGAELIKEGMSGSSVYLILSGRCEVRRRGKRLAFLEPGEFFGELSILDPAPRTASVIAIEPVTLLVLSGFDFRSALQTNKNMALHLVKVLAERLRNLEDEFVPSLRRN